MTWTELSEGALYDEILGRMLRQADENGLDTRESSISYAMMAPVAQELAASYLRMYEMRENAYVDTADLQALILKAEERGLVYREAGYAVLRAEIQTDSPLSVGERFSVGNMVFSVIGAVDETTYELRCESAGEVADLSGEAMLYLGYAVSVQSAVVTGMVDFGSEAETADQLRQRYYEDLNAAPFGGNVADYRQKTLTVPGVGGVQVRRAAYGAGTVGLVLVDENFGVPAAETVTAVQNLFDPIVDGEHTGGGLAPFDHVVTAMAAEGTPVLVATRIDYETGYDFAAVQQEITQVLNEYFMAVAEDWANTGKGVLRIGKIESALSTVDGILEAYDTLLNGNEKNLTFEADSIPVLGEVSEREADTA